MNAAARLVHQGVQSRHLVLSWFVSRKQLGVLMLTLALLFSALSIVYATHETRLMHTTFQRNLREQQQMQLMRTQLLLERSVWATQSRIEQIAENKLGMVVPERNALVIVHE